MKICYFGIYNPNFSRNKIYMAGLRSLGHEIVECRDDAQGFRKWINLYKKLSELRGEFDAIVVGYPGHIVVPLAKFLSHGKPVIADLLGSLWDAERNSHQAADASHWKLFKTKMVDELAVKFSDIVLVESEAQKEYFEMIFGPKQKYRVLYTGSWLEGRGAYRPNPNDFVVLFRGSLTPECGIRHILDAAKRLKENRKIRFKIVGRGKLLSETEAGIRNEKLDNVELVSKFLSDAEFARQYDDVSLALGQFEENPRLSRTIPHKAFEALVLGVPYLTGDGKAIGEIIVGGETGFVAPLADPQALARRISELSTDPKTLIRVSEGSTGLFVEKFSHKVLGQELSSLIYSVIRK